MYSEIRLYFLTRFMKALCGDFEKAIELMKDLLGESNVWPYWEERFDQINHSRETQVLIMREVGVPYRTIQKHLDMSPNTIRQILNEYELNYTPLENIEDLENSLDRLEKRLQKEGTELW